MMNARLFEGDTVFVKSCEDIRQPNTVYKFEGATIRVYGNCSNIQAETEKFLKQVMRGRRDEEVKQELTQQKRK